MFYEGHGIQESCSQSCFESLSYKLLQSNMKALLVLAFGTKGLRGDWRGVS